VKDTHKPTEEEFLREVIEELKDAYELDMRNVTALNRKEDVTFKLKGFVEKVNKKAKGFLPAEHRYRHLCSVTSFVYALVMASRVRSHYTHAPWFKLRALGDMLDVHGTVSSPPGPSRWRLGHGTLLIETPAVRRRVHRGQRGILGTDREHAEATHEL
jgi:hypothetical protein